jgi:hypothetical protein|tara:strand:- start:60292 stop:60474 length:183 start_codon:yes stop_codon:yes gene_type:complete
MSQKVKAGEQRESGWLYFVKGKTLEVWKAKMARGGRKKKKTAAKKTTKRKTVKKKAKRKR